MDESPIIELEILPYLGRRSYTTANMTQKSRTKSENLKNQLEIKYEDAVYEYIQQKMTGLPPNLKLAKNAMCDCHVRAFIDIRFVPFLKALDSSFILLVLVYCLSLPVIHIW